MTADHIGDYIPDMPLWLRWIGRISSPLFFFCAAEGAVHTSDRRRYLKRLWQASAAMAMLEAVLPAVLSMYFRITLYDFDNNIFLQEMLFLRKNDIIFFFPYFRACLLSPYLKARKTTVGKGQNIFCAMVDISLYWQCFHILLRSMTQSWRQA